MSVTKNDIVQQLKKEVLALQGGSRTFHKHVTGSLGLMAKSFPNYAFPTGTVHECISYSREAAAATNGFIASVLRLARLQTKPCLWVSCRRTVFPPALNTFDISAERIIFIDAQRQKDALWIIEEALKCKAVSAVIGEIQELSFTESRRLQLAVENSQVTGFIHRHRPRSENTVACTTRWKIESLPSHIANDMPGIGYPRWNVRLLKVRNGKPGAWHIEWSGERFNYIAPQAIPAIQTSKTA